MDWSLGMLAPLGMAVCLIMRSEAHCVCLWACTAHTAMCSLLRPFVAVSSSGAPAAAARTGCGMEALQGLLALVRHAEEDHDCMKEETPEDSQPVSLDGDPYIEISADDEADASAEMQLGQFQRSFEGVPPRETALTPVMPCAVPDAFQTPPPKHHFLSPLRTGRMGHAAELPSSSGTARWSAPLEADASPDPETPPQPDGPITWRGHKAEWNAFNRSAQPSSRNPMPQALREEFLRNRNSLFDAWMRSGKDWGEVQMVIKRKKELGAYSGSSDMPG